MLIKLALIICVICALNGAKVLTLHEKITTNGGGMGDMQDGHNIS